MVKNHKAKGIRGERELIHLFNDAGWSAIRVAGSGSSQYPSPDIVAGNAARRVAIECKVTKERKKYFEKEEIEQLQFFSKRFGAEGWVGIKFPKEPWHFLRIESLESVGNSYVVSVEQAKEKGVVLETFMRL